MLRQKKVRGPATRSAMARGHKAEKEAFRQIVSNALVDGTLNLSTLPQVMSSANLEALANMQETLDKVKILNLESNALNIYGREADSDNDADDSDDGFCNQESEARWRALGRVVAKAKNLKTLNIKNNRNDLLSDNSFQAFYIEVAQSSLTKIDGLKEFSPENQLLLLETLMVHQISDQRQADYDTHQKMHGNSVRIHFNSTIIETVLNELNWMVSLKTKEQHEKVTAEITRWGLSRDDLSPQDIQFIRETLDALEKDNQGPSPFWDPVRSKDVENHIKHCREVFGLTRSSRCSIS